MNNKLLLLCFIFFTILSCKKNRESTCPATITDIDGNVYSTVEIGSQCWMKENLKTSKYNDGTTILTALSDSDWVSTDLGACADYENDVANTTTYGKLYNWQVVHSDKLAPDGWHVPSNDEWLALKNYLGGEIVAGDKMKATGSLWNIPVFTPPVTNNNSSGFTGLPAGYRSDHFYNLGYHAYFWSSTEESSGSAYAHYLSYDRTQSLSFFNYKFEGLSVRCVKN